jgi:hypothetical protein
VFNRNRTAEKYDVIIVGGGMAGIGAAVGAAKAGAATLLIDKNPYFGGTFTHSSVASICGLYTRNDQLEKAVGGVADELLTLIPTGMLDGPVRGRSGDAIVIADPEAMKVALDQLLERNNVQTLLHTQFAQSHVEQSIITEIECLDYGGAFQLSGKAYVDASGDGNLAASAGAAFRVGDGDGHYQTGTLVMRIGGVKPDILPDRDTLSAAIIQAKNAGVRLTKERGALMKLPGSGDWIAIFADEAVDALDARSLTAAETAARKQAWHYLELLRAHVPGFDNAYLLQTGPSIGIRESRHLDTEYTLTADDVLFGRRQPDGIARGGWPVEVHPHPGAPMEYREILNQSYFDIPLRSLKPVGITNLWCAGRMIGCDQTAFASVRVMGTAMATGQAAGVAAAQYARTGVTNIQAVREELLRQGAIL